MAIDNQNETDNNLSTVSTIEEDEADKSGDSNSTVDSNTDNDNNENEATPKKSVISLVEFADSSDDSDSDGYISSDIEDVNIEENVKLLQTKVFANDAVSTNDDGPSTSGVKTSKAVDVENSKSDVISISSEDDSSRLITVTLKAKLFYH